VAQRLTEREDVGLGRAVDAVQPLGRYGDGGSDVDDRTRAARHEARGGSIREAGERDHVELDHVFHLRDGGFEQWCDRSSARIVDEHRDGWLASQRVFHSCDCCLVTEVGREHVHRDAVLGRESLREGREPQGVARDEDQVVAALGEPVCLDRADASGGAGDDGSAQSLRAIRVHGISFI
jgi:hypothetical protein